EGYLRACGRGAAARALVEEATQAALEEPAGAGHLRRERCLPADVGAAEDGRELDLGEVVPDWQTRERRVDESLGGSDIDELVAADGAAPAEHSDRARALGPRITTAVELERLARCPARPRGTVRQQREHGVGSGVGVRSDFDLAASHRHLVPDGEWRGGRGGV